MMDSDVRFCVSCGHGLRAGISFCEKCGAAVPGKAEAPVPSSVGPKPQVLPPTSQPARSQRSPEPTATSASSQTENPPGPTASAWMLPVVGLALVLLLMGVGIKLLKGSPTGQGADSASGAPSTASTPSKTAVSESGSAEPPPEQQPEQSPVDLPLQTNLDTAVPEQSPPPPPAVKTDPFDDDIPGIERIPLDRAESYLPLPRSRYRHYMAYPDGDDGHREMVVAVSDDSRVTTILEFTHSRLYPDDPPGLWVNHYVARPDGVYRFSDDDPYRAELWLPNDLALGKTWSNVLGDFEVVGFDETLTVNGVQFQGVLAYRHRSSITEVDQTIWLGLGHGEILARYGSDGAEFCRLLKADSEPESRIEELMQRHVVNLDKVR